MDLKTKPPSRLIHRKLLLDSLENIFSESYSKDNLIDSVEGKLFGIGYEEYTVGSHEFYLLYALKKKKAVTFDTGHFHPTELVSDKISSALLFLDNIALHISRGVRWDSDHVPLLSDELIAIMQEIKRADAFERVFIGTDFFDGSINRIGAWVIGARAVAKALLYALLEPTEKIVQYEKEGNLFAKLALMEDLKTMPFSSVWAYYLESENMPSDIEWINEVLRYEREVLDKRQ